MNSSGRCQVAKAYAAAAGDLEDPSVIGKFSGESIPLDKAAHMLERGTLTGSFGYRSVGRPGHATHAATLLNDTLLAHGGSSAQKSDWP
jgi:hypothetical protein